MNKRYHNVFLQQLFGSNTGTWMLIMIHVFILVALVLLFSAIIARMQYYL